MYLSSSQEGLWYHLLHAVLLICRKRRMCVIQIMEKGPWVGIKRGTPVCLSRLPIRREIRPNPPRIKVPVHSSPNNNWDSFGFFSPKYVTVLFSVTGRCCQIPALIRVLLDVCERESAGILFFQVQGQTGRRGRYRMMSDRWARVRQSVVCETHPAPQFKKPQIRWRYSLLTAY